MHSVCSHTFIVFRFTNYCVTNSVEFNTHMAKNYNDEGTAAISVETFRKMEKVLKIANKAVFKVKAAHGEQGTGALYEIIDKFNCDRFLIMTCNHVLPSNSVNEITEAKFESDNIVQLKSFNLTEEQLKNIWTNKTLDCTVIEISSECANLFKSYGAIFLKVGIRIAPKDEVAMLQFQKESLASHMAISGLANAHNVYYQIGTAPGSSGSPLLDLECNALAMHKGGQPGSTADNPETWRQSEHFVCSR